MFTGTKKMALLYLTRQSCMTADPSRLVAQLTSAGGSIQSVADPGFGQWGGGAARVRPILPT